MKLFRKYTCEAYHQTQSKINMRDILLQAHRLNSVSRKSASEILGTKVKADNNNKTTIDLCIIINNRRIAIHA